MRISDWSSDVCSSDLRPGCAEVFAALQAGGGIFVPWLHAGRLAAALYVLTAEPRRWNYSDLLTLQEAIKAAHDVIAMLRNEQRQILLMREIDHRAKNALSVVQAVVRLTHADDIDDFRKVVEGRIESLARAHDLLAENRWDGLDLRSLIEQELRAFADDGERLRIAGPALRLPPQLAQTIAMALHELRSDEHTSAPQSLMRN